MIVHAYCLKLCFKEKIFFFRAELTLSQPLFSFFYPLQVIWFRDTMQLDTTERHIMENRGSRHTLIIRKVHPQDFGNYSCNAENQLGKSKKYLQLSGKPNTAIFRSAPISQYKDR